MIGTSAYLSLLDDWDILEPALRSVIDRVDEIVVVDGAYRWMRPYFDKKGRDPSRSVPQVYDALARLGPKIKVINGIWENEVEKRIAGYSACNARYRYRVDADEIFFFDEPALARFFESDYAVGQMQMPIYVAPGFVSGGAGKPLPCQSFLFDAEKISAVDHLSYLWLILPEWEREKFGAPQAAMIFPEPLAFNAHLTHWRPPSSSLARARFYIMNYMRQFGGAPADTGSPRQPVTDFTPVFERISPADFDEILLGKLITVIPAAEQFACRETPLTAAQEQQFSPIYDQFLASLAASNLALQSNWRTVQRGDNYYLDATLPESLPVHGPENLLVMQYSDTIAAMKIELSTFFRDPEQNKKIELQVRANGDLAVANIPPLPTSPGLLRRIISLAVWTHGGAQLLKLRLPHAVIEKTPPQAIQAAPAPLPEISDPQPEQQHAASPAACLSGHLYGVPSDLTRTGPGLKNVLVVGSCLISALPQYIRESGAGCESDFILFNNGSELPAAPPRPVRDYDFQIIQIATRSLLQEPDYFRLRYADTAGYQDLFDRARANLARVLDAVMRYNAEHGLLTLITNFFVPQQNPMGRLLPRYDLRNPVFFFEELNRALNETLKKFSNVHVLDIELLSRQFGKKYVQDDAVWSFAHNAALSDYDFEYDQQRLQPVQKMSEVYQLETYGFVQAMWAEAVAMYRTARQIDAVKLVVIDLDDTLWRGVLAEEENISWTALVGWPLGFVEALLFLKNRGVMLAIVSKNDPSAVERTWKQLMRGLISMEDFVVRKINWAPKPENFAHVLQAVNILPENAIYIDDNPVEREAIRAAFPRVRVLGANPYLLKRILLWSPETQVPAISEESSRRTEMVQQQVTREAIRQTSSRAEFLQSLELRMRLHIIAHEGDAAFPRVFELINKTNQYNTTGRRWKNEEMRAAFQEGWRCYAFDAQDKFSNYGLIAVAVTCENDIEQFVMSCRVVGLGVEAAAIAVTAAEIFKSGAATLRARIVPTDMNFVVRDVFEKLGFLSHDGIWIGTPEQIAAVPSHISFS